MYDHLTQGRHLNLEGAYNVRDLGGYLTLDGRHTRWRAFLRGDTLHRLSPASQDILTVDYGIRTVIDLRNTRELQEAPDVFADSPHVTYVNYNIVGDNPSTATAAPPEVENVPDWILGTYRPWLDDRQAHIRRVLAMMAEPGSLPVIFHCAGGKDRTGVIAALALGIAGVPTETIAQDYALTARFLFERDRAERLASGSSVDGYTWKMYQREACPPEGMLKVLNHLEERYGGIEGYVRTIGLSAHQIESLRTSLVE